MATQYFILFDGNLTAGEVDTRLTTIRGMDGVLKVGELRKAETEEVVRIAKAEAGAQWRSAVASLLAVKELP